MKFKNILALVTTMSLSLIGMAQNNQPIRLINSQGVLNPPRKILKPVAGEQTSVDLTTGVLRADGTDRLAQIKTDNPGKSPYEILKQFYEESKTPAALSDMEYRNREFSTQHRQHCVIAELKDVDPSPTLFFHIHVLVGDSPAVPSQGPLFPAKPAVAGLPQDLILPVEPLTANADPNDFLIFWTVDVLKDLLASQRIQTTETDLVVTFKPSNNPVVSTALPYLPLEFKLRKNGSLIASYLRVSIGTPKEKTLYGYCYNE